MKKAILSNRIYMEYTPELYEKLKKNLVYKIPSKIPGGPPTTLSVLNRPSKNILSIPIGRTDLIPRNYVKIEKRVIERVDFPEFKFTLRPSQELIYNKVNDNCLINANTSWGKTFTGIAIATKLKQKTLVITHTVALRDQWTHEVKKTLDIDAGQIGSGLLHFDSPITIANVQTLRKYTTELSRKFGTIIVDECHHTPSKVFTEVLNGFKARYKIGLSATLERKDMLHIVLEDYFGKTVFTPPEENVVQPSILMVKTKIPFSSNKFIPWANKVNELTQRPEFFELVTTTAKTYADNGHKVLVLSDRTEFLESCHLVHEDISALVIGTTKNRDELHKEVKNNKNILYGAISIYKEGISLDFLSCLVVCTPVNNNPLLKQLIGRIKRPYPDKLAPVVIDFILDGATAKRQAYLRTQFYIGQGYKIRHVEL